MCITTDNVKISKIVSQNFFLQLFKVCILTKFLIFTSNNTLKRVLKIIGFTDLNETYYTPIKRYGEYFGAVKFFTHNELKILEGF